MPDNNRKVLSESMLCKLNNLYTFTYDAQTNTIITHVSTCKRQTAHNADEPFLIISKRLNKNIIFNLETINMWITLQDTKSLSKYSLFDVHNAISKLKMLYQPIDKKSVVKMLQNNFMGIKTVY